MPAALKKEETKEALTPMMQQTQDMIRQNLITQGFKPQVADMVIKLASDASKGKEVKLPPPKTREDRATQKKMRDAVEDARDLLALMPKLMKKGYNAEEAYEIVGRARPGLGQGFQMPGFNRIEDYDVSSVKETLEYLQAHPKADYRMVMADLIFRGPVKVPPLRQKAQEAPKTEVAEKEETKLGGRLAMIPRKIKPELRTADFTMDDLLYPKKSKAPETKIAAAKEETPKPAPQKAVKTATEYVYNLDIYGQPYMVTLNVELKGKRLGSELRKVLEETPEAVMAINTPNGDVVNDAKGLKRDIAYMLSVSKGIKVKLAQAFTFGEESDMEAVKEEPSEAQPLKATSEYAYVIDIYGQKYGVTLNKELKGKDLKAELFNVLQKGPAAVISVTTPRNERLTDQNGEMLEKYVAYLASQYRAFMKELKVESV